MCIYKNITHVSSHFITGFYICYSVHKESPSLYMIYIFFCLVQPNTVLPHHCVGAVGTPPLPLVQLAHCNSTKNAKEVQYKNFKNINLLNLVHVPGMLSFSYFAVFFLETPLVYTWYIKENSYTIYKVVGVCSTMYRQNLKMTFLHVYVVTHQFLFMLIISYSSESYDK